MYSLLRVAWRACHALSASRRPRSGASCPPRRRTGRRPTPRCSPPCSASSTSSAPSRRPCSSWPARAWCTGPRTPPSARRAARSARSWACAPPTRSTARTAGTTSSSPRRSPTSPRDRSSLDALVTPEVAEVLQRTLAEILGLAQGYCAGRGGSMHLQWFEAGALGTNAIVGGGVPMAAGNAWAQQHSPAGPDGTRPDRHLLRRRRGQHRLGPRVAEPRLGLEAAGLLLHGEQRLRGLHHRRGGHRRAPAVGPRPRLRHHRLAGRRHGPARGAPGHGEGRASGSAPGEGPVVVEALVYRFFHQNGPYPGSAFGYRTKEEEAGWRARDPLDRVARRDDQAGADRRGRASPRSARRRSRRCGPRPAALVEPDPAPGAEGRARGASARSCGRTRRSSTSASAATCPSSPGRGPPSSRSSPGSCGAGSSSRRWRR